MTQYAQLSLRDLKVISKTGTLFLPRDAMHSGARTTPSQDVCSPLRYTPAMRWHGWTCLQTFSNN